MDENKKLNNLDNNQENVQNSENQQLEDTKPVKNEVLDTPVSETKTSEQEVETKDENSVVEEPKKEEKKKTAADLILERLKGVKAEGVSSKKIEDLKKIEQEVKTIAQPDTREEEVDEEKKVEEKVEQEKMPNYNEFSRIQLVEHFRELLTEPYEKIVDKAEVIKNTFYKKRNSEINERKQKFIDEGGEATDFNADFDDIDNDFKAEYEKFRALKQARKEQIELQHQQNLEKKYGIIDHIEKLINTDETLNNTFNEFHKLREEWNNAGTVPQTEAKTLLEKYNYTLQKFYDWVKINKELRDLDLKRNLDKKIKLCEEAETLIIEPKIVRAYNKLQHLHSQWKEIGPVPKEQKEEIWNRFKETSSLINKKHYEYFQEIKEQQNDNLKAKELLCEETEKIAEGEYTKSKEWQIKSDEINELMKLWKLIGFAPKKFNNSIFERFIAARNKFYDKKHEYYQSYTEILEKNLQQKEELIVEADRAKDNTDWKQTTNLFIDIQKRWKLIGPVPNVKKDEIWKKFNEVCNHFFEAKRLYFVNRKEQEENNLKLKKELIEKIKSIEFAGTPEENLKTLQELQKQWAEIGYVPFKQKDAIYGEYKEALDENFKKLNIDFDKRREFENKNRIENILSSDKPENKIRFEIDKVKNDIATLKSEIITIENNLTFFVKSKNSSGLLDNLNKKLKNLKNKKEDQEKLLVSLSKAYREATKK